MRHALLPIAVTAALLGGLTVGPAAAEKVTVPGRADPWLAGMPAGATASRGDVAPADSPVQVLGLHLIPGAPIEFAAFGLANYEPPISAGDGPDGNAAVVIGHATGAENGIADVSAPANALMGVFLGPEPPDLSPAPLPLDFRTPASRDYRALSPALKQVFFIGDGLTDRGDVQRVVVPGGATRLYLGTMDGFGWSNNVGFFRADPGRGGEAATKPGRVAAKERFDRALQKHEGYSLPVPIGPRDGSDWVGSAIVSDFAKKILNGGASGRVSVDKVDFDGSSALVHARAERAADEVVLYELPYLASLLFGGGVPVRLRSEIVPSLDRMDVHLDTFSDLSIKPEFVIGGVIDVDKVWEVVVRSVADAPELEIDSNSIVATGNTRSARTKVKVIDGTDGYVTRYWVEFKLVSRVTENDRKGGIDERRWMDVCVDLKPFRRLATKNNFTQVPEADLRFAIRLSGGGFNGPTMNAELPHSQVFRTIVGHLRAK